MNQSLWVKKKFRGLVELSMKKKFVADQRADKRDIRFDGIAPRIPFVQIAFNGDRTSMVS
jgi:hypothetical protein